MTSHKTIVFGPTGAVGSATALTAAELGAHVVLAMRDPSKPIPGLDAATEKAGSFERVTADLTKPDTVRDAVRTTGAKHAFIYCAHAMPDHMKSTIEALKSAGIELVVFLSSFTIQGDPKAIEPSEMIPYLHAQVEINLAEIFGKDGFVAARGGSFASNTLQYRGALLAKGSGVAKVKVHVPHATLDCIAPEDIGRVCGTVLAKGPPHDGNRLIYLYGPELLSQTEVVRTLGRVLGRDLEIETADDEEAYKMYVEERGVPKPVAEYMIRRAGTKGLDRQGQVFGYPVSEEQLGNVERYGGRKAMAFEEWVGRNRHLFLS